MEVRAERREGELVPRAVLIGGPKPGLRQRNAEEVPAERLEAKEEVPRDREEALVAEQDAEKYTDAVDRYIVVEPDPQPVGMRIGKHLARDLSSILRHELDFTHTIGKADPVPQQFQFPAVEAYN
jgi:hypothetical protein